MENAFIVPVGGAYYAFFYNLAFIVAFCMLLFEAHRRRFPMLKWIILLVFTRIFLTIGTKVITYSVDDWMVFFRTFALPEAHGKSLTGGLLFGMVALMAGRYFLKLRNHFFDGFALVLPVSIGIHRLGCFFTGCCYGKVSQLPWSIMYPAHTLPHFHHYEAGQLAMNEYFSLAVHPVQLYELTGMLLVAFLVFSFRKQFKVPGSLMLYSLCLVMLTRFVTEFFRDPSAHTIGGKMFWFMNMTQWAIIPLVLVCVLLIGYRESRKFTVAHSAASDELSLRSSLLAIMLATMFIWVLRNWLSYAEMLTLAVTVSSAVALMAYRLIRNFYLSPYRWYYLVFIFLPLVLMSQTNPEDSEETLLTKTYKSVGFGFASGERENTHNIGHGSGCDRVGNTEYFDHKYVLAGAHYSVTREKPDINENLTYGIRGYTGSHKEERSPDMLKDENFLLGINPYVHFNRKWVGIGGGIHLGSLVHIFENKVTEGSGLAKTGVTKSFIYPLFNLRLGHSRFFFIDYHLADHFPSALPGFRQQLGIGTGFGSTSGMQMRFGTNFDGLYVSGIFPFENKIILEPHVVWARNYGSVPDVPTTNLQFSIGLSYRFDYKITSKKQ